MQRILMIHLQHKETKVVNQSVKYKNFEIQNIKH